jgi:hypothetical protein
MSPPAPAVGERQALLITTCDMAGGRSDDLARLIESLDQAHRPGIAVRHHLLLQRLADDAVAPALPAWVAVDRIPSRVSLSAARNRLLRRAHADGSLARADLVAFPDDDAWYPPGLLPAMLGLLDANPAAGVVVCRYASAPLPFPVAPPLRRDIGGFVRTASSNTLFVRGAAARAAGLFDEQLGLGAPVNGGEDLDYALRVLAATAAQPLSIPLALVGHRDPMKWVRGRYFAGSLAGIARARGRVAGMRAQHLRKLLVGVALVLKREIGPRALFTAISAAHAAARREVPAVEN